MSNKLYKHLNIDKWEAYIPSKRDFFHDGYSVSSKQEGFHLPSGFASGNGHRRGFSFGIQKKVSYVSGHGIKVSDHGIGESDS